MALVNSESAFRKRREQSQAGLADNTEAQSWQIFNVCVFIWVSTGTSFRCRFRSLLNLSMVYQVWVMWQRTEDCTLSHAHMFSMTWRRVPSTLIRGSLWRNCLSLKNKRDLRRRSQRKSSTKNRDHWRRQPRGPCRTPTLPWSCVCFLHCNAYIWHLRLCTRRLGSRVRCGWTKWWAPWSRNHYRWHRVWASPKFLKQTRRFFRPQPQNTVAVLLQTRERPHL